MMEQTRRDIEQETRRSIDRIRKEVAELTVLATEKVARKTLDGNEHFVNFLELVAERHRMPAIFRIRREFDGLWREENKLLEVRITSAVELDEDLVKTIGS